MKIIIKTTRALVLALTLLCIVLASGCTGNLDGLDSTPDPAAPLSGMPADAELVYTYTSHGVFGVLVTTDIWSHTEDTGFFALELLCESGGLRQLELRRATGETVAAFGDVRESGLFMTDLVTDAAGDYLLYFEKSDYYDGQINVYFVPGIGYAIAD